MMNNFSFRDVSQIEELSTLETILEAGKTYIIKDTLTLPKEANGEKVIVNIPDGVTLWFQGGMIVSGSYRESAGGSSNPDNDSNDTDNGADDESNSEDSSEEETGSRKLRENENSDSGYNELGAYNLIGHHTRIIAPMTQIFDENLDVSGSWCIEAAFPSWFGMKAIPAGEFYMLVDGEYNAVIKLSEAIKYDCSTAINKAMRMKQSGKVFIPTGQYILLHSIFIPDGIQLCGDCEYSHEFFNPGDINSTTNGTVIFTLNTNSYDGDYPIYINALNEGNTLYSKDGNTTRDKNKRAAPSWYKTFGFPCIGTAIKGISFARKIINEIDVQNSGIETTENPSKCIKVHGAFEINNLNILDYDNIITTSDEYSDCRKIISCNFGRSTYYNKPSRDEEVVISNLYDYTAVVIRGNGDALQIYRNQIDDRFAYAFSIATSGGGTVADNIINSPIEFRYCIGITFESNHLENGAFISAHSSNIQIRNNFFIKGAFPSVIFSSYGTGSEYTQATISGNIFVFDEASWTSGSDTLQTATADVCEYDIGLTSENVWNGNNSLPITYQQINIQQNYRDRIDLGRFGPACSTGATICQMALLDENSMVDDSTEQIKMANSSYAILNLEEFNRRSWFLSINSNLVPNNCIIAQYTANNCNTTAKSWDILAMRNEHVLWLKGIGEAESNKARDSYEPLGPEWPDDPTDGYDYSTWEYSYQAIPIWDYERCIVGKMYDILWYEDTEDTGETENESTLSVNGSADDTESTTPKAENIIKKGQKGVLFVISDSTLKKFNYSVMLRLYRTARLHDNPVIDKIEYVDIPICGTKFLYDNGISISGYKWKSVPEDSNDSINKLLNARDSNFNSEIKTVKYDGENVTCYADSAPSYGEWKNGDTFINTSPKLDEAHRIMLWADGEWV